MHRLRGADELTAAGETSEKLAAELEVSFATVYDWRRSYGGMYTDVAKELHELRKQTTCSTTPRRRRAERYALREVAEGNFRAEPPSAALWNILVEGLCVEAVGARGGRACSSYPGECNGRRVRLILRPISTRYSERMPGRIRCMA